MSCKKNTGNKNCSIKITKQNGKVRSNKKSRFIKNQDIH